MRQQVIQVYPEQPSSTQVIGPSIRHSRESGCQEIDGWIIALRPSRQLLRSFLRMRNYLNAIKNFLMLRSAACPEGAAAGGVSKGARLEGTRNRNAANCLTASKAGAQGRWLGRGNPGYPLPRV